MHQKKLPQGLTYDKLYQKNNQNIWFLTWVLKKRRCNPDFNQEILSAPFTVQRKYWSNGQLLYLTSYQNGQPHGLGRSWNENGQLWWEREWHNGQRHGLERWWSLNGKLSLEEHWQNGQRHGLDRAWFPNGQLRLEEHWQNGKRISRKYF